MKKIISLIFVLAVVFIIGCGKKESSSSDDKKITIRIGAGHVVKNITWIMGIEDHFVKEVDRRAKELGYEITWIKSYGGSVAKLGEALESVRDGILDISYPNFNFEPSNLIIHNLGFRIPFTSKDPEIVSKATIALFNKYPEIFIDVYTEKHNQVLLGVGVTDNYAIYSKVPIKSLADLKGLKVGGGGAYLYYLKGTGATPVMASLNEAYTSLQTGVIDAEIAPLGASYGVKLHEVAPYVALTDFGAKAGGALTINLDALNGFPEDLREIIIEVGMEYPIYEAKITKDKYEEDLIALEEEGAVIYQFTDDQKEEWVNLLRPVVQEAIDEFREAGYPNSKEILDDFMMLSKENGYDSDIDWDVK